MHAYVTVNLGKLEAIVALILNSNMEATDYVFLQRIKTLIEDAKEFGALTVTLSAEALHKINRLHLRLKVKRKNEKAVGYPGLQKPTFRDKREEDHEKNARGFWGDPWQDIVDEHRRFFSPQLLASRK